VALAMAERESGDNAAANALTEESLQLAQRLNIPRMIGMVWFQLATISFNEGRIQEAQERHRKAAELFRTCNERGNEARVYSRMALALAHLGDYAGALEMIGRAEDMLRQADDLPGVAQALTTRSSILFHRSEFAAALQAVNAAGEIFARLDDKRNLAMVDGNRALLARQLRRLDESLVLMLRTGEQAAELGDLTTLATNHMNMGLLYLDLDRWDDAERAFADGARLAARQSRPHFEAVCRENLCLIRGLRGDSAGAIGELRALIAGLPPTDRPLRGGLEVTLAELLLMAGKTPEALQVAKSAHEHLTAAGITHNRDYFRALLALARANAACGDKVTAQQQAAQALKLAEALGFGDQDPSPRVRRDLQAARALA
jgi:tetratricopeptide (TPR) repeat protein